ncbi:MAG: cupin domain-containing protein [Polyangiaceae bacterium]|nr:cupin domain-containing protein [Polyangiaceae bacterium]
MTVPPAVDLRAKLATFSEQWSPRIVASLNDYHVKVVRVEGAFVWHQHAETDELFLVLEGELTLRFRDGQTNLRQGELCVVPKGVEHQPYAERECHVLLLEPAGTLNTGDSTERAGTTGSWG